MLYRIAKSIKYRALSVVPNRQTRCALLRKLGVRRHGPNVGGFT